MLGKLMKYELKATGRLFIPLFGALLAFSIINKLFFSFDLPQTGFGLPVAIGIFIYVAVAVSIFVLTFIVMIQRFQKNLLSDEGYLMFTLPVKTWELIVSKLTITLLWFIASVFVTGITILVMAVNAQLLSEIPWLLSEVQRFLQQYFGVGQYLFLFELLLLAFVSMVGVVLQIYASISIGHLFGRHRFLASFGAFIVLNIVEQIFTSLIMWITRKVGYPMFELTPETFFNQTAVLHYAVISLLLITLITTAAYFLITNYVLSRRLNLD